MEPVEVFAGAWYLRALRDDDRLSDVGALARFDIADPADYVRDANRGWADESRFVWAVCVPTTGETVALIGVVPTGDDTADLVGVARDGHAEALSDAAGPVARFAEGALGLTTDELAETRP
ncbi:hypothetical protein L5I01_31420 [Gordonia sp. HY442]|uniref:hypothetical protein n=1 Tax=Gordonia zhenghanii TaxID=2911516 RepID=UPI001F48A3FC|nr:hypothetical protein [Gordonia zhenghanii]MCF8607876.1 hypothetical protein [Gordonia zhenghanii]